MEVVYHFSKPQLKWNSKGHWRSSMASTSWDWLFNRGSLTHRLKVLSDDEFKVIPLREEPGPLLPDECRLLGVRPGVMGWIREVYLAGFGRPWIYARSVVAQHDPDSSVSALCNLGDVSLGSLLFGDTPYQRGEIEVCRYPDACNASSRPAYPLWARRSVFRRGHVRVLVHEMFLPALWEELS
ncbi:chorismate--pyruvate lyase family protein [Pseudomonas fluorescens]|uniref:Probable chorismate pyruvate-lyase n=1 Tax=Pseudomonas fluorescens TaxID=294 RepID=A0A5E7V579_PSEFL|nr:chorismate lyase [Pseudomonas fluorescens]VVO45272.1 Chorismate pyruvate-lyase [Pseudomonas fluorescens]VVQ18851.1 Chorismate pyruvate-lyase [Pseudomonas fluorescens]